MDMFCILGFDKAGRPNIYCKCDRYLPANSDTASILKYVFEVMRFLCVNLPPKYDSFNALSDCSNFGWNNFDMAIEKAAMPM